MSYLKPYLKVMKVTEYIINNKANARTVMKEFNLTYNQFYRLIHVFLKNRYPEKHKEVVLILKAYQNRNGWYDE